MWRHEDSMKKTLAYLGTAGAALAAPFTAFAQRTNLATQCRGGAIGGNLTNVACTIYRLINIVIPLLILGAVAYFIWGIVQFMTADDGEKKSKGRGMMLNGIISFAVILGLWGLVYILLNTFGVNRGAGGVEFDFPTF